MSSVLTGIAFDQDGRVDSDLPCRSCQYNLRMQPQDGDCPECRTAVRDSVAGYYLVTCDLGWLKTLRRGMLTLLLWPLFVIGITLLSLFTLVADNPLMAMVVMWGLSLGLVVIMLIAIGWLTKAEPNRPEASFWTARQVLRQGTRVTVLLPVVLIILGIALMSYSVFGTPAPAGAFSMGFIALPVMFGCSYVLMLVMMFVLPVAYLRWLGAIAQRCPAPKLANFTRTLSWGTLWLYGVMVLFMIVTVINGIQTAVSGVQSGFKPVDVKLSPAHQQTLDSGGTLLAQPVDPNDPNGVYKVVADPQALTPAQMHDPNLSVIAGSITLIRDPMDPNRVVTFSGGFGGAGMMTPNWAMMIGVQGVGCLCWLIAALMYVVLFPSYGNLNRIVQAIEDQTHREPMTPPSYL